MSNTHAATVHPLVAQLHFARTEFLRCMVGVTSDDAMRRIEPMNCLSWIVAHLAAQEHYFWVEVAQDENVAPGIYEVAGFGSPPTTPDWDEVWDTWRTVTETADRYLLTLTPEAVDTHLERNGRPMRETVGTSLLRNLFHYWFHTGEAHAVRQMLGHEELPQFVGDLTGVDYVTRKA